ncbi:hypothetical protein MTR67_031100 [Solanum verrucosum]|uniref:Tf2-1-like SH3-like domain-containing protein n=1 Tax=Solanum verrucosum TaxID=315347 RepID=A0AAF0ZFI5_SOLVR|nr:hypothetical protein MTR67_031100 [Solanum verrucosum]
MLRACVMDFKGNWDDHLSLIEFAYNNSYHSYTQMALYQALYEIRYRYPIGWFKVVQSCQKSYTDVRRRDLEFEVDDWVYLKVSPLKSFMRFGKKGKLNPQYIGPYKISKRVGNVAYELELLSKLAAVHPLYHISMLKKCLGDPTLIVPIEHLVSKDNLSYEEMPVHILDRQIHKLRTKKVALVKVFWRNLLLRKLLGRLRKT